MRESTHGPPAYTRINEEYTLRSRCQPNCRCICHSPGAVRSPTVLGQAVGQLLVWYSCVPLRMINCRDPNCDREKRPALSMTYFFPTWLLDRRIVSRFAYSAADGPEFLLRVARVVPSTADVFNFARTGNVQGLQYLFKNGLASPFDANSCGLTALHLAIHRDLVDTSRFLIHAGADIYLGDDYKNKPIDTAWKRILSRRTSDTTTLERLFNFSSDSSYAITRQFSTTHKAVLKLEGLATALLPDLIAKVPEINIDATDVWGMTALAWAAQLNDTRAIHTLLYLGANPDKTDTRSYTPLMRTTDTRCMELLIDAGASIDARDNLYQTALFAATQSPSCVRMLLRRGASVNLVERSHGLTASHFCVINNRAESLRVLLRYGADFGIRAIDGNSLLYTAVRVSDVNTLEVLIEAAESGLIWDKNDSSKEGAKLQELVKKRVSTDGDVGPVLHRLLTAVEANMGIPEDKEDTGSVSRLSELFLPWSFLE
ncbi:ankyrin [Thozetella sp. PMI_491]|nr:ankyrin [Thozetella sp. PMI_491]